jgi:hypothetical protein
VAGAVSPRYNTARQDEHADTHAAGGLRKDSDGPPAFLLFQGQGGLQQ